MNKPLYFALFISHSPSFKNLGKIKNSRPVTRNCLEEKFFLCIKNEHYVQKKFTTSGEDLFFQNHYVLVKKSTKMRRIQTEDIFYILGQKIDKTETDSKSFFCLHPKFFLYP